MLNMQNNEIIKILQLLGLEVLWKRSYRVVPGESPKTLRNCGFPQNFHAGEIGEIMVFYAVLWGSNICRTGQSSYPEFSEISSLFYRITRENFCKIFQF